MKRVSARAAGSKEGGEVDLAAHEDRWGRRMQRERRPPGGRWGFLDEAAKLMVFQLRGSRKKSR